MVKCKALTRSAVKGLMTLMHRQQGWKWDKKQSRYETLSISLLSFLFTPSSFPVSLSLFLSRAYPPPNPARALREHYELPSGPGHSPVDKRFLVHFEFIITLPVIALLQKFSDNQVYVVTCIGPAIYRCGICQKRRSGMVSSRPSNCRHTSSYRPTSRADPQ